MDEKFKDKIGEALISILPVTAIILAVCFFIIPVSTDLILMFLIGALLLIAGMGLFSLGAESSMSLIGERIGASLSKSKNIWLIAFVAFLFGMITTVAEPDLQVLATQIQAVPNIVLVGTVGIGVGIFLAIAMLRIVFKVKLSVLLIVFYLVIFGLSFFVPENFLPLAFDSGGVTTGPMTVPFIIALGIGAASIRNDKDSESDSFGLVALCSIGPIIAVMILGLVYKIGNTTYVPYEIATTMTSKEVGEAFIFSIPKYCVEVLKSLAPILIFFGLYNTISLKLAPNELVKIVAGFVYTFLGIVIFLTGVNVGFLPVGNRLGIAFMDVDSKILIIVIMQLIGYFIVKAEPAVQVLIKQVSEITDGMVSEKAMIGTLSVGMALALVISVIRVWVGIPIYYILIPGYLFALILTFFTPEIFTGIAFDSGGVLSGPMTASFMLPLIIGMCEASGRANINIMQDAFGLVSMVAMMPLITIQIVGISYFRKKKGMSEGKKVQSTIADEYDGIIVFPKKVINKQQKV